MVGKKLIFVVFTTAILSFGLKNSSEKSLKISPYENKIKRFKKAKCFDDFFNETINFIKSHEGWRSTPYLDTKGYRTIGFGFITRYLPKRYRNYITKEEAHQVIIDKLKANMKYADILYDNLTRKQCLAVAHLAYAKGFGTILKHELHKQLKEMKVIDDTWINFGKYEKIYCNKLNDGEYCPIYEAKEALTMEGSKKAKEMAKEFKDVKKALKNVAIQSKDVINASKGKKRRGRPKNKK